MPRPDSPDNYPVMPTATCLVLPDEKYICLKCSKLLCHPVQIHECGHRLCYQCFKDIVRYSWGYFSIFLNEMPVTLEWNVYKKNSKNLWNVLIEFNSYNYFWFFLIFRDILNLFLNTLSYEYFSIYNWVQKINHMQL